MIISNYKKLLEDIKTKQYKKILISGPQRSGTTILSRILSQDLSYELHDELKDTKSFKNTPNNSISQGPSMCCFLHEIEEPDTLIVFISRNCNDIIISQKRIILKSGLCWNDDPNCELSEKKLYAKYFPEFFQENIPSCYIKQNVWLSFQMFNMKSDFITFPYDGLMVDDRYIQKDLRVNFTGKQTQ